MRYLSSLFAYTLLAMARDPAPALLLPVSSSDFDDRPRRRAIALQRMVGTGSIATGNRWGGEHKHQREIARRRRQAAKLQVAA